MEQQFFLDTNGQELQQGDVNLVAAEAALADDRTLVVLLDLPRMNEDDEVFRGILPTRDLTTADVLGLVRPSGADGSIILAAFRAFVGSRTAEDVDALENYRDTRSAIVYGEATALDQGVTFAVNASGDPRWDLVYAAVTIDANDAGVTRYIKDPATSVIAPSTVVVTKSTQVSIGIQAGTATSTPAFPAVPADSGSTYYIPIAYVRIPDGFGATSQVLVTDIVEVYSPVQTRIDTGVHVAGPAGRCSTVDHSGSSGLTTTRTGAWGATGTAPPYLMASDMVGMNTLWIALDLADANSANWSHQSGAVLDDRHWRDRIFTSWWVLAGATIKFAFDKSVTATTTDEVLPSVWQQYPFDNTTSANWPVATQNQGWHMGQSMIRDGFAALGEDLNFADTDDSALSSANYARVFHLTSNDNVNFDTNSAVDIYVDTSGKLKLEVTGTPGVKLFIRMDASGPMSNRRAV